MVLVDGAMGEAGEVRKRIVGREGGGGDRGGAGGWCCDWYWGGGRGADSTACGRGSVGCGIDDGWGCGSSSLAGGGLACLGLLGWPGGGGGGGGCCRAAAGGIGRGVGSQAAGDVVADTGAARWAVLVALEEKKSGAKHQYRESRSGLVAAKPAWRLHSIGTRGSAVGKVGSKDQP